MLGLGLGLTKGGFIPNFAKTIYKQYVVRVTAAGGVFQNAVCALNRLLGLNSQSLLKQASLVLIPDGIKEDVVFSQVPTTGAGDFAFARASDATYTDSTGVIRRSPYNLLQQSETFDNASWVKFGSTITANQIPSPRGTTDADLYTTTSTSDFLQQSLNVTSGVTYTISAFVKNGDANLVAIIFTGAAYPAAASIEFNLTTQTATVTSGTATASIQDYGNGWYRIVGTSTAGATASMNVRFSSASLNTISTFYIWGAQVNEGTSALDYFPTTDRLNVPRIDFRNADGTLSSCGRLLLEPQRTNLILRSEEFDNTAWTSSSLNVSVSSNVVAAPNGTNTADLIVADAITSNTIYVRNSLTLPSTGVYTFSVYAKKQNQNTIGLRSLSSGTLINYDLDAETSTGGFIQNVGGGWFRIGFSYTAASTSESIYIYPLGTGTRTGNGVDGVYVWGAQVEAGSFVSTYIPTTTATVTRLVDIAEKFGVGSLIGSPAGTIFLQVQILSLGYTRSFISLQDASYATNSIRIESTAANRFRLQIRNASSTILDQTILTGSAFTTGNYKLAYAYDTNTNGVAFYVNGVSLFTTTVASIPTACVNLFLGTRLAGIYDLHVSDSFDQAALFPTRLSNAELATLTTL